MISRRQNLGWALAFFVMTQVLFYGGNDWVYPLEVSLGMIAANILFGLVPALPLMGLSLLVLNLMPARTVPIAGVLLLLVAGSAAAAAGVYWGMLIGI